MNLRFLSLLSEDIFSLHGFKISQLAILLELMHEGDNLTLFVYNCLAKTAIKPIRFATGAIALAVAAH